MHCTSKEEPIPRIEDLKDRVQALYRAEQRRDWRACYAIFSPQFRKKVSFDEFAKQANSGVGSDDKLVSFEIRDIALPTNFGLGETPEAKVVKVGMDVWMQWKDGTKKQAKDQTDYWQYVDGKWYWTWRGWPTD